MTIITPITNDPTTALLRLMAWLSPVFPVGSFSYSHGLERAVHDGLVVDAAGLQDWLQWLVRRGSGWNDAVLCAESWRCTMKGEDLHEIAELAEALAGSRERHMETMLQGGAFLAAARSWPCEIFDRLPPDCAIRSLSGRWRAGMACRLPRHWQRSCRPSASISCKPPSACR